MKIAVDAMGGDQAPHAIVSGSVAAAMAAKDRFEIVLVGDEERLTHELSHFFHAKDLPISIYHASQQVEMSDSPSVALKEKKDSSISVATRLHKQGFVDAVVSAGNTGAVLASALVSLRKIKGVKRPAIGSLLPNGKDVTFLIDAGTNVDCKPLNLLQFGIMGSIFYQKMVGKENPTVGLLNIGEEEKKGNEISQKTYQLMNDSKLNFIGNVEGNGILKGKADVIVCDGFVGNIILKFAESFNKIYSSNLRNKIGKTIQFNLGAYLLKPAFLMLKKTFDYAEYGGVPILGINGVCIVCHGGSSPKAIKNAIFEAEKINNEKVNQHIEEILGKFSEVKIEL